MGGRHQSLVRLSSPLIVSFWMRAGVTLIDTIYASLIGDPAVAAIGLTIPLEFLMIALWVGLSTGLTSALARAMGAGQGVKIAQLLAACWRLVCAAAPLFTLIGASVWLLAPLMGLEPDVSRALQVYGTVLIVGSAFTTFWSIIPDSLVKAHQDTRSTMWAGIWTNLINLGLNTLFLFVFHWGIFGIALSTVLGRIGGLWYALARARWHENRRQRENETPGVERELHPYRAILKLAVPSSITFGMIALETALVNFLLSRMQHATQSIAAYSIYHRVVMFSMQPIIATSVAMLLFAAKRVGASDFDGVRQGLRQAMLYSAVYCMLVVGPLMMALAPWLAAGLAESPLTSLLSTFALRLVPLACLTSAPFMLCRPVFEAMNRGRPGLLMAAFRYVVLSGPLAWAGMLMASRFGQQQLYGLILGLLAASSLASAAFYLWLRTELPGRK
jgi:Na+-driven multidrug efflux pump